MKSDLTKYAYGESDEKPNMAFWIPVWIAAIVTLIWVLAVG